MIVLFTDFGADDIYVAQVKAVLLQQLAHRTPIVDLLHAVPGFGVAAGAHLLAALQERFPRGTVFLAVVDPGVGTDREAALMHADGKWYVGPDNGLLSVTAERAAKVQTWRILWQPPSLSASFHGRDLFAPFAAWVASGVLPEDKIEPTAGLKTRIDAGDCGRVIYVDHYGNALTGIRARNLPERATLMIGERRIGRARLFAEAPAGEAFWYENSIGLAEIAVNRASAADFLGIGVGDVVTLG
jgi:S-adenosyl-L-methionine hydrolase (adenosine-forming)